MMHYFCQSPDILFGFMFLLLVGGFAAGFKLGLSLGK